MKVKIDNKNSQIIYTQCHTSHDTTQAQLTPRVEFSAISITRSDLHFFPTFPVLERNNQA